MNIWGENEHIFIWGVIQRQCLYFSRDWSVLKDQFAQLGNKNSYPRTLSGCGIPLMTFSRSDLDHDLNTWIVTGAFPPPPGFASSTMGIMMQESWGDQSGQSLGPCWYRVDFRGSWLWSLVRRLCSSGFADLTSHPLFRAESQKNFIARKRDSEGDARQTVCIRPHS